MRSVIFLLTGLLCLVTFTSATPHHNLTQDRLLRHLPGCAHPAVEKGVGHCLKPGGESIDKACVCGNIALIEQMKTEVKAACSRHKYKKTIHRAKSICPGITM